VLAVLTSCWACGDDAATSTVQPDAGSDLEDGELDPQLEHTEWQPLFDAELRDWYTFLPSHGRDSDPDGVFELEAGVLHVLGNPAPAPASEQEFGYIATRSEYGNYRFRVEQRWGTTKFAPRAADVRDSGLLYHMRGADSVWPLSVEFQIQENDIGDLFLLGDTGTTTLLDPGGIMFLEGGQERALRTAAVKKGATYESLTDWNALELIASERAWVHAVNSHVNHRGYALEFRDNGAWQPLDHGRILLQAEGAEVFYREAQLRPLQYPAPPSDAIVLFDGTNLDAFQGAAQQAAPPWNIDMVDGALEIEPGSGDLLTREAFTDVRVHLELKLPARRDGDAAGDPLRGSSLFLASRHAVKLRESYGLELSALSCGAVGDVVPQVNEGLPIGVWQSLDVVFRAARFNGKTRTRKARITVVLNGSELYRAHELEDPADEPSHAAHVLRLSDEGVRVSFRNLWLQKL